MGVTTGMGGTTGGIKTSRKKQKTKMLIKGTTDTVAGGGTRTSKMRIRTQKRGIMVTTGGTTGGMLKIKVQRSVTMVTGWGGTRMPTTKTWKPVATMVTTGDMDT